MRALLYKEWKLAMHPAAALFWALSAMVLIPNYPYFVVFFYTALGIFFICLTGRENRDIEYMLSLPLGRRDVVRARFTLALVLEGVQWVLTGGMVFLRSLLPLGPNLAGMDANVAFLGLSLCMMGLFNAVFFPRYYGAPQKVGAAFGWGCVSIGAFMAVIETFVHIPGVVCDRLDTPDPAFMAEKTAVLALGVILFVLLTQRGYRVSLRRFERIDL